jgi:putative solute:sodium symporter small subunit
VSPSGRRQSGAGARSPRQELASPRQELADSTEHGEVYLRRLRHAQLQLSLLALVAFGAVFGVLPLAIFLLPHLQHTTLLGIPVTIWVLIVPLSPLFIAIGWLYAHRADALDDAFRDLVEK